eukprot:TRINITY_DN5820_c0_g1_i1.p1 TRINITY_DN5820_c0_g1~~TRINITY_DN5820_c0_g1_i1.p1  ORF type:complete len:555 (-),score=113.32 TRINITY_DN5820_c0_g1_i1:163-1827(-)
MNDMYLETVLKIETTADTRPQKRTRGDFEPAAFQSGYAANIESQYIQLDEGLEGADGDFTSYLTFEANIPEERDDQLQANAQMELHYAALCLRLNEIQEIYNSVKDQIEKIKWTQKQLTIPPDAISFENLNKQQKDLLGALQWGLKELKNLYEQFILHPKELTKVFVLKRDLQILEATLNVYQTELMHLSYPDANINKCFAALVVLKQPFPKAVKKDSKLTSDPVTVSLIRGPKTEIKVMSQVKAILFFDDQSKKEKESLAISNDVADFDSQGEACFSDLRFPAGTRLKMVRLQFSVHVQYVLVGKTNLTTTILESEPTEPFVVMTNENQWDNSAGILLKKDAFDNSQQILWPQFANTLQLHYLRATRQSLDTPTRVLSRDDLEYIFTAKFNSKMYINQKEYDEFWEWFGKALHRIRHQKHFGSLWLRGFIYGFVSKPDAEKILIIQRPGSFIIRFSESTPGKLAVAYVKTDATTGKIEIKHYMIDPRDKKETQTLPEFLAAHENLLYWLQIKNDFIPGPQKLQSIYEKYSVLKDYLAKKESAQTIEGYEEVLE